MLDYAETLKFVEVLQSHRRSTFRFDERSPSQQILGDGIGHGGLKVAHGHDSASSSVIAVTNLASNLA